MKKRCGISALVAVILIFVMDFICHGILLKGSYQATPQLWRGEEAMKPFMLYMLAGQVLVGIMFATIFAKGYKGTGSKEGLRFGLLMGTLAAGQNLIMYTVAPYEFSMVLAWIGVSFLEPIVIGLVLSKLWGSATCSTKV